MVTPLYRAHLTGIYGADEDVQGGGVGKAAHYATLPLWIHLTLQVYRCTAHRRGMLFMTSKMPSSIHLSSRPFYFLPGDIFLIPRPSPLSPPSPPRGMHSLPPLLPLSPLPRLPHFNKPFSPPRTLPPLTPPGTFSSLLPPFLSLFWSSLHPARPTTTHAMTTFRTHPRTHGHIATHIFKHT